MAGAPVLGQAALNRALVARQLLLRRHPRSPRWAVEHLVALQAQEPLDPYVALWSRLAAFDPSALSRSLERRAVVRLALLRGTVHLCTVRDARALRPWVQPVLDRMWRGSPFAQALDGVPFPEVVAAGRAVVEEAPLGTTALGRRLQGRWPGRDPLALGYAVRTGAALVQVPPRALWGRRGAARATTLEHWTGQPPGVAPPHEAVVLRYLRAFGPASVRDAQAWCGMTRLGAAFDRLAPRLRAFEDEAGRELFDLPRAPRPPARTPCPPRLLPQFDNLFLGHADRTRLGVERWAGAAMASDQGFRAPFLVQGRIAGMWKVRGQGKDAVLRFDPFAPFAREDRTGLAAEGRGWLRLAHPGARGKVVFAAPR